MNNCIVRVPKDFDWEDFNRWCEDAGYPQEHLNIHDSRYQEIIDNYLAEQFDDSTAPTAPWDNTTLTAEYAQNVSMRMLNGEEVPSEVSHYNTNEHVDGCGCDECEARRQGFPSVKDMYDFYEAQPIICKGCGNEDDMCECLCEHCGFPKPICICKCGNCGITHAPGECELDTDYEDIPF